jgi:hypothetical protein
MACPHRKVLMPKMMTWRVAIPAGRRPSPRFGLGNFYALTQQRRSGSGLSLGNIFRQIPLGSFYRQASPPLPSHIGTDITGGYSPLPSAVGTDLSGATCPAAASGQPCPLAAKPAAGLGRIGSVCPAIAHGHACPLHGLGRVRLRLPRFGMGALGDSTTSYVNADNGWSVSPSGIISDNNGGTQYVQGGAAGTYGPFIVDDSGNIVDQSAGGLAVYYASTGLVGASYAAAVAAMPAAPITGTNPTPAQIQASYPQLSAAQAQAIVTAAPTMTAAQLSAALNAAGAAASSTASLLKAPTGYSAVPAAAVAPSWWNGSTSLFGTTIKNSTLAIAGLLGGALLLSGKKKGK